MLVPLCIWDSRNCALAGKGDDHPADDVGRVLAHTRGALLPGCCACMCDDHFSHKVLQPQ